MWRHVVLVKPHVTSTVRVERITEFRKTLAVTSVLTRATWRYIQENGILHSGRHENLKSDILKKFILLQIVLEYAEM
jgi:hypothetical protein